MIYVAGTAQPVDTGDTYFAQIAKLPLSGAVTAKMKLRERFNIATLPVLDTKPIDARIEYARWIVDCPNCGSAEFAFEDKLFFCEICGNSDIGGQIRKVKMHPQRKEIEKILGKRKIVNRHWTNETIEDLEKENNNQGVI